MVKMGPEQNQGISVSVRQLGRSKYFIKVNMEIKDTISAKNELSLILSVVYVKTNSHM